MFDWRPHRRGWGAAFCMACVDAPRLPCGVFFFSASSPLPSHLDASVHPKNNSFAGLPTGFCGSDSFMCAFLYFVEPWLISLLPFWLCICLYISSVCCSAFYSLAVSPSFLSLHWSDCYIVKASSSFNTFAITLGQRRDRWLCARSLLKRWGIGVSPLQKAYSTEGFQGILQRCQTRRVTSLTSNQRTTKEIIFISYFWLQSWDAAERNHDFVTRATKKKKAHALF